MQPFYVIFKPLHQVAMWVDDWDEEEKEKVSESLNWGKHLDTNKTDVNQVGSR